MDTPARLLRLLVLFSSRASWNAAELTERLEVNARTVRRDVTRLRHLGYPIESTTGPYGGYALGPGGRLPPLLLDDDEAVAVSVALGEISRAADPTLGEAAVSALTKLAQVLPSALRKRVATLGEMTVGLGRPEPPPGGTEGAKGTDMAILMALANACREQQRMRFGYRTGDDVASRRHAEPHRLVSLKRRWYLVAFDVDRADWRTFRVDRISAPVLTGAPSQPRQAPDAAALVAKGVAVRVYDVQARIRLHVDPGSAAREISPTIGVLEPAETGATSVVAEIGGDADWIARYLVGLPFRFEVIEPAEVRAEVRRLAHRMLRQHPSLIPTG